MKIYVFHLPVIIMTRNTAHPDLAVPLPGPVLVGGLSCWTGSLVLDAGGQGTDFKDILCLYMFLYLLLSAATLVLCVCLGAILIILLFIFKTLGGALGCFCYS